MLRLYHYGKGESLAYADYGSAAGKPILVQHGMIASIEEAGLFQCLVDGGRRVLCLARPGYGDSSPLRMRNMAHWGEIVAGLADALGLEQFDVLGISSGAPYSCAIGYHNPTKARTLYIFSGTPALYDPGVLAHWPYPLNPEASLEELQSLAFELFFAHLPPEASSSPDVRDSMRNACFGIAQDLKLRCNPWGFTLEDVRQPVVMEHSRADEAVPFAAAEISARMLPNCRFLTREGGHFSAELLEQFLRKHLLG